MGPRLTRAALLLAVFAALMLLVVADSRPTHRWAAVPTANPQEQARDDDRYASLDHDGYIGVKVSALQNQRATDDPLSFDHAKYDTAGFWDPDNPTRLTLPDDGFYHVRAQITILGSAFPGSAPASDVWVEVARNGDPTDFVCVNRKTDEDETRALHVSCATTDWFLAGDYLEVFAPPGKTVESNWPGRGNVSPVLLAEKTG